MEKSKISGVEYDYNEYTQFGYIDAGTLCKYRFGKLKTVKAIRVNVGGDWIKYHCTELDEEKLIESINKGCGAIIIDALDDGSRHIISVSSISEVFDEKGIEITAENKDKHIKQDEWIFFPAKCKEIRL